MRRFLERFSDIVSRYPDRIAFKDGNEQLSYQELDKESGRVYRYLKEQDIGKEQFVTIYMEKNVHFPSAMLGVSKAGAAYILIEEGYPAARVDYIKKDSGSLLTIDKELMEHILKNYEPMSGYEETDLHDAAYAVYTSGSTGNPKGVLHEYGNLDQCAHTAAEKPDYEESILGFPAAINFVATQLYLLPALVTATTVFLISGDLMRNFAGLQKLLLEEKIETMFFPPSYLRHYDHPSPYLKMVITGSAPAYGIYYPEGPAVKNNYAMSETGFFVFEGILEKSFDNAPVGKPVLDIDLYLIREDESIVEGVGEGELCFENEFVRGYLNLPEQTKKAFRPMKDHPEKILFHTNDMVRREEDGRYYIVGRIDDMIKIDGNRIEPGEIEAGVKRVTGLSDVMAKGFQEKDRAYVAAYFLRDEAEGKGIWDGTHFSIDREKLARILPGYMIPTYYVPLDAFPLNANGKMTRKGLNPPDMASLRKDYVMPETDMEKYLCEKMAHVLRLDKIGVTEDFFEAGGSSLSAIDLISACDRLRLSTKDVYEKRTVRELAKGLSFETEEENPFDLEGDMQRSYPLLPGQQSIIFYQNYMKYPATSNMAQLYQLKEGVDLLRLRTAVEGCIKAHPALLTRIFRDENGAYRQRYDASFFQPVGIVELSEAAWKEKLARGDEAFALENAPLYRCTIYVTGGTSWLWFSLHHIIGDGSSMNILLNDIYRMFENPAYVPARDVYFSLLARNEKERGSFSWRKAEAYYANLFQEDLGASIPYGIRMDFASKNRGCDVFMSSRSIPKTPGRDSSFFLTAFALAECWYHQNTKAAVTFGYNDRGDADRRSAAGYLVSPLVVLLDLSKASAPREMLAMVRKQVEFGMSHTEYSFLNEKVGDYSEMARFLYQKDILTVGEIGGIAKPGPDIACHKEMGGVFSLAMFDNSENPDCLFGIKYSVDNYKRESVERFATLFQKAVDLLGA